ncbi:16S rRNA (cytidine(1402)-2'-O)-methyltransferase, partial [candidate division WWE3 bacterium RBG_13_37_7]
MNFGQLYIVATPIGNLNDTTFRAIEVLKNVDLILSEDTRETLKVLRHFNMEKPQLSYRDQNHNKILPEIISLLENGKNLALVSDSGTPLISDPGFKLVRELLSKGFKVESIPGPSALISALVVSGLPTDKFAFLGFLPKGLSQQKTILETYGKLDATLIVYESPYRIKKLLETLHAVLGNRQVCIANELTKLHEKLIHGDL